LEDRLWEEFKRLQIKADRQRFITVKGHNYFLDFALYCVSGKIDIETDGDVWHANPERAAQDNLRDNDLKTVGWEVLRFNGHQIREQMEDYCLPTIVENIKRLGGLDEGEVFPRRIDLDTPGGMHQLGLSDIL
jgi:very-short-patch-repair endonuclease